MTTPLEDGWQPIETAPKDGTRVDVWAVYTSVDGTGATSDGRRYENAHWHFGGHFNDAGWFDQTGNRLEWAGDPDDDGAYAYRAVTHWMPLPTPPGDGQ